MIQSTLIRPLRLKYINFNPSEYNIGGNERVTDLKLYVLVYSNAVSSIHYTITALMSVYIV